MKIGIYFTARKEQGGVYSYSVEILEALNNIPGNKYVILSTSPDIPDKYKTLKKFRIVNLNTTPSKYLLIVNNLMTKLLSVFNGKFLKLLNGFKIINLLTLLYRFTNREYLRLINTEKLDLIFYPVSSNISFLSETPSIVTVHDLQHRLNPKFKEVSADGRWEQREYGFINIGNKAFRIFVDSKIGKEDMLKYYPKSKNKVVVLPYLAPNYIDTGISKKQAKMIATKLCLPEKYIYYPAKFWPHKNHINLIKAVDILKKEGVVVNLVLSGSKDAEYSSFNEVKNLIKELDLEKQVCYLGYLSNRELSALYKLATALVMPTFFGPTNIPVLEAWLIGTPVIYSNIRGCREQLGDAGLLINPKNPFDIAKKIETIYKNPILAKKLVKNGIRRVKNWTKLDFSKTIVNTINDFYEYEKK